ncbi:hypothetical protein OROMI_027123 [Orobanche minor]
MSFIRGSSLFESSTAFEEHGEMIAEGLRKIIIFDMVIHNADRLKCKDLEWGGNDVTSGRLGKSPEVDILDTAVKSNAAPAVCAFHKGFLAAKEDLSSLKAKHSIEGAEGLFTSSFTSALKKFVTSAKD